MADNLYLKISCLGSRYLFCLIGQIKINKWKQTVIRVLEYAQQAANEETKRRKYEVLQPEMDVTLFIQFSNETF